MDHIDIEKDILIFQYIVLSLLWICT